MIAWSALGGLRTAALLGILGLPSLAFSLILLFFPEVDFLLSSGVMECVWSSDLFSKAKQPPGTLLVPILPLSILKMLLAEKCKKITAILDAPSINLEPLKLKVC